MKPIADMLAMADDGDFRERWWAVDPRRNIARNYELSMSTDLFGWTIVERRWGRIGTKGQGCCSSFADRTEAIRLVDSVRRRRASARKRLGVEYTPVRL